MKKKQSNYIICFILTFLLLSMNIQVFGNTVTRVTKVSLNKTTVILTVGRAYTLKATITPTNAKNKAVRWTSSNTKIAKIDATGKVTALKIGTVTITATTVDKGLKATCKVTIKSANEDISSKFKDKNFKNYVYNLIGKSSSEPILYGDVKNIKSLNLESMNISSLSGIEYFTALITLDCSGNQLKTLDVSKNIALSGLDCAGNQLTILDISKNIALSKLNCGSNQLATLDASKNITLNALACNDNQLSTLKISKSTLLTNLNCSNNKLATLDVSKNITLTYLDCSNNQLTTLDVNKNIALLDLRCFDNQLTTLDVSKNTSATDLYCSNNQLTILDISNNIALSRLGCSGNQLTTLDVSNNIALSELYCPNNQLTTIDVSKNIKLRGLNCKYNQLTNLYSIEDTWDSTSYTPQYTDSTRKTTTDSLVITIKK